MCAHLLFMFLKQQVINEKRGEEQEARRLR